MVHTLQVGQDKLVLLIEVVVVGQVSQVPQVALVLSSLNI
jgi:hypothetical protein